MSEAVRTAVIGVGHQGRFHAEKLARHPRATLEAVVDLDPERCGEVAATLGTRCATDYRTVLPLVDAVSIAVPTRQHFPAARFFLENGKHVLLEKPISATIGEADELIRLAKEQGVVFQVGHLERFNPAVMALQGAVHAPLFIESLRISPFRSRGTDVCVVLDLMIHDIDIIRNIVQSPVLGVSAVGAPVYSSEVDIANARLEFANGCVANITASRISLKSERTIRIFQKNSYIVVDFRNRSVSVRTCEGNPLAEVSEPRIEKTSFPDSDPLGSEVDAFLTAITAGQPPTVGGEEGKGALELALIIREKLEEQRQKSARGSHTW